MLPYRDSRITRAVLIVFFILLIGYAYYEARGFIYGPRITVADEVTTVSDPYVVIQGQADRISKLSMNGNEITVTEGGKFAEPYLLAPGLNRILLDAEDKYGRSRQEIIQIVYVPPAGSVPVIPTSTASTTPRVQATSTATTTGE